MLIPAYHSLIERTNTTIDEIKAWPLPALKDCLDCTEWNEYKQAATYNGHIDLEEYTSVTTSYVYIAKYIDDLTSCL